MYSREVVDKALHLHSQGHSDRAVANACGVSLWTVRHWRYGRRRGADVEARRRDRTSCCPKCSSGHLAPEAYAYLLGLYLGDGYIGRIRNGVDYLAILCADAWPELMSECAQALAQVFPVKVYRVQRQGSTEVKAASKHWRCVFPQHGPGRKHTRRIILEPWQREIVDAHPEKFVRGLMHSDGWRGVNRVRQRTPRGWKYYEYPRYDFVNASRDIVNLMTDALDLLGVPWTERVQRRPPHQDRITVSVARRDAVARLDEFVGAKG
ncbi:hypothetical protein SAMN05421803_104291 [Nocardiopsis flavescens]|uniref:DOD-type homing endonuclease domain-containing protein n=1 Tax=Nocardiopsis flavescens TaxID=758803 RepID=A0A1M6HSQ1_9ACTN|nr:transcriptional regulator [Nocardiopsis flavescens]SHJ25200.1 hypothetical protein SAMN05421803_104291 [Nocardiopsis flavescens]